MLLDLLRVLIVAIIAEAVGMMLNQFSNFVKCLSSNCRTDEQMLSTPEHVQPIWQECPLTLGIKPL